MTQVEINLNELKLFCIKNLKRLYNSREQLFHSRECFRSKTIESSFSYRYSIIALLGLSAHPENEAIKNIFDLKRIHLGLIKKINQCDSPENLGLLLWLDAENGGEFLLQILSHLEKLRPQQKFHNLPTYELAWLLTGLAYALQNSPGIQTTQWAGLTHDIFQHFKTRYCQQSGIFYHCAVRSLKSRVRQNISDFADQIYSVYALATYYQLSAKPEALDMARLCAHRLSQLQGPNGEWWWLYNTRNGSVMYRYPVYSVHQDGMAPMAYTKLVEVTGENWEPVINRSISWLFENNCYIKIDLAALKIVRGVRIMPPFLKHLAILCSMLHLNRIHEKIIYRYFRRFDVINEYRAYHLGWILYFIGSRERLVKVQQ